MHQFTLNGRAMTYQDKVQAEKWQAIFRKTATNQVSEITEVEQIEKPKREPIFFLSINDNRAEFPTLAEAQQAKAHAKASWYNKVSQVYTYDDNGDTVLAESEEVLPRANPDRIARLNAQEAWED